MGDGIDAQGRGISWTPAQLAHYCRQAEGSSFEVAAEARVQRHLEDYAIRGLRQEAAEDQDDGLLRDCAAALAGEEDARRHCLWVMANMPGRHSDSERVRSMFRGGRR